MAAKLKRVLRLYGLYARMDYDWFTQDTFVCALVILSDIISNIASVSGILLLSMRFGGVGGLSADEVLFMLGFFTLADGLVFMFAGFNISSISRRIGRGQLDHMLIQPAPLWMQFLTEGFLPVSGNAGFLCGLILTIVSIVRLRIAVTLPWLLLLLAYLLARCCISLSVNFLVGSSAFYRPAACEEISSLANDLLGTLGRYPLSGLPDWLLGLLTTVVPAGMMAWMPSLLLLRKLDALGYYVFPIAVAAVLLLLARTAFQKGMKHYVKYSCNRYRDLGHRS